MGYLPAVFGVEVHVDTVSFPLESCTPTTVAVTAG